LSVGSDTLKPSQTWQGMTEEVSLLPRSRPYPDPDPWLASPSGGAGGAVPGDTSGEGLDWQALLEALAAGGMLDGDLDDDRGEVPAEEYDAAGGRMGSPLPLGQLAALAVEHMEPGPALAGWLDVATASADALDENGAAGVVMAARRQTAHTQAAELAGVARITALAAAADPKIGVADDGRPARLCRDALGQISLALTMSPCRTGSWADLAVTLTWRLRDTGAALVSGRIDLDRARAIADATAVLTEEAARSVESAVLPHAPGDTIAELKRRLRRAVIKADPAGAEDRCKAAQRQADVRLYADPDQTASLVGDKLPQIETAAGYARLTAMARARKAAGLPGTLGFHRAQVLVGMLNDTVPPTPPPAGSPPDQPPPDDDPGPSDSGPGDEPADSNGGEPGPGETSPESSNLGPETSNPGESGSGGEWDDVPAPRDEDAPEDDGLEDDGSEDAGGHEPNDDFDPDEDLDDLTGTRPLPDWPELGTIPPALARRGHNHPDHDHSGRNHPGHDQPGHDDRDQGDRSPAPGPLEIILPWTTLAGLSDDPGTLSRIGPVTATQARQLIRVGQTDPATQWRIVVTDAIGRALAVTRIRRRTRVRGIRDGPGPPRRDGPGRSARHDTTSQNTGCWNTGCWNTTSRPLPPGTGLVGRVTLTITGETLARLTATGQPRRVGLRRAVGSGRPGVAGRTSAIAWAALRAASKALDQALARGAEDSAAGGCAHGMRSAAYRPPPRVRDLVTIRDQTCRFLTCGMPAAHSDLDHTIPYDHGGPTCPCNLGGGCRGHHQLKQHPRWRLDQPAPGVFVWTTPAGRTYTVGPDPYPV
jgi:hypothetical protein